MGMYTLLVMDVHLKVDTPDAVREIIHDLVEGVIDWDQHNKVLEGGPGFVPPDHPFFACDRWDVIATMGSAYFDEPTWQDFDGERLRIQANLKNYDSEIEKFLDWLGPHIDVERLPTLGGCRFIGRRRYEGYDSPNVAIVVGSDGKATTIYPRRSRMAVEPHPWDVGEPEESDEISDYTVHDGNWPQ